MRHSAGVAPPTLGQMISGLRKTWCLGNQREVVWVRFSGESSLRSRTGMFTATFDGGFDFRGKMALPSSQVRLHTRKFRLGSGRLQPAQCPYPDGGKPARVVAEASSPESCPGLRTHPSESFHTERRFWKRPSLGHQGDRQPGRQPQFTCPHDFPR